KLVVFTAFANVDLALKALDAGAHAFVLTGRPADDLYDAIQAVRRGDLFVSPEFSQRVVAGFRNRARRETAVVVKLSARASSNWSTACSRGRRTRRSHAPWS